MTGPVDVTPAARGRWRVGAARGALLVGLACASGEDRAPVPVAPSTGIPEPGSAGDLPLGGDSVGDATGSSDRAVAVDGPVQEALQPLPTVRQEHAAVAVGAEVFVVGGFTPGATASVVAYDPASDRWRSVADFPEVLHHANAAAVGGLLFVTGFYSGASFTNPSGAVYAYDPALGTWTGRAALPAGTERAAACVATLDERIYVFGGARGRSVSDASVYDPADDRWEALPPLPEPREHCAAGALDGKLVIAGGRAGGIGGFQPSTWAYDPVTRRYEPRASLPTARGGVAGAVLAGKLYLFGGEGNARDPSGVFPEVDAYDPTSDTWQSLPDMLSPRHGLAAAASGERIYLPGGASRQGFGAESTHTVFFLD